MKPSDIFSYIEARRHTDTPDFEHSYLGGLLRFSHTYERFSYFIKTLESFLLQLNGSRKTDFLFVGTKYIHLMKALQADNYRVTAIVYGWADFIMCRRQKIPCVGGWSWRAELTRAYKEIGENLGEKRLQEVLRNSTDVLHRLSPRLIVLETDSLFLHRALIFGSRTAGISVATIQHGLFMKTAPSQLLDGHFTDVMLVWGQFFRDVYSKALPNAKTELIGYPYPIHRLSQSQSAELPVLCFLGQPLEENSSIYSELKFGLIKNVITASHKVGFDLVYRPHPRESRTALTLQHPGLKLTPKRESLQRAIQRYDCFMSLSSTSLVEASLFDKVAVQILHPNLPADNFEDLGACHTISSDFDDLIEFVRAVADGYIKPFSVDPHYICASASPHRTLIKLFESTASSVRERHGHGYSQQF